MTSEIKVNKVSDTCGSALVSKCGSTITIGASGKTIALASGASQTGFGRSGSVNWQTTPKTSTFTAVSGEGYFVNSGSALTMNLPAGSAGAIVAVSDYARNFSSYNLTVAANGSEKIGGSTNDAILNIDGQASTFVYVDSTKGWVNVQNAEDTEIGIAPAFVSASGGNTVATVCTNFKVHTFTSPGTFTVCSAGNSLGSNTVSYMVVGGGGSGGADGGGGGGAGGFREGLGLNDSYTGSPLRNPTGVPVSVQGYPIVVGAGGSPHGSPPWTSHPAGQGSASSFSTISSAGGGLSTSAAGGPGGSGGGGGRGSPRAGGTGNTPPVSPAQGTNGGNGDPGGNGSAGGGGGTVAGTPTSNSNGGAGGTGATTSINATPTAYAGGGGGGATPHPNTRGAGGTGGGGNGAGCGSGAGINGTANTGGGSGGGSGSTPPFASGSGGSGIVIIRYKFQ